MIPMKPDTIHQIWKVLQPFEFDTTHGLFNGWEVRGDDVKGRVLESMKIQIKHQGFDDHALFSESWP